MKNQTLLTAVEIKIRDGYARLVVKHEPKASALSAVKAPEKESRLFLVENRNGNARREICTRLFHDARFRLVGQLLGRGVGWRRRGLLAQLFKCIVAELKYCRMKV